MTKEQTVVELLINSYKQKGYVTEDEIFDVCDEYDLELHLIDYVGNQLNIHGVLVADAPADSQTGNLPEVSDYSQTDYEVIYKYFIKEYPSMRTLIKHIRSIAPPQNREFANLLTQYRSGNKYVRQLIIEKNYRVALKTVYSYRGKTSIPLEDLFQVAIMGIMRAVELFDPYEHSSFSAYINMWMMQILNRYVSEHEYIVEISYQLWEKIEKVRKIKETYYDPEDFTSQIERALDVSSAKAHRLIYLQQALYSESFEQIIKAHDEDLILDHRMSQFTEERYYRQLFYNDLKEKVNEVLSTLSKKEEMVIRYRFGMITGDEMTLEEVGNIFHVTKERIRQIEVKALRKLKHHSRANKLKDYQDFLDGD